jgi:hypothetical protein
MIGTEAFMVVPDNQRVRVVHLSWSLMGVGASLPTAVADLMSEARAIARLLAADDASALSPEARRMREFVASV